MTVRGFPNRPKSDSSFLLRGVREKVSPYLPGAATDCGVTAADKRLFLETVSWRVRTGSPWRDLPVAFGKSNRVFQRFRGGAKKAGFRAVVRGSIGAATGRRIRPHRRRHRQRSPEGGRREGGTQNQAIGRSRGGLATKIVALVDPIDETFEYLTRVRPRRHPRPAGDRACEFRKIIAEGR